MQRLREQFGAALDGAPTPFAAADRLGAACVELLDVDGGSISLIAEGFVCHTGNQPVNASNSQDLWIGVSRDQLLTS